MSGFGRQNQNGAGGGIGAFVVGIGATGPVPPAKLAAENPAVTSAAARTIIDFLASDMVVSVKVCEDAVISNGGQSPAGARPGLEARLKRF
jgi:hypothetical protein